MNLDIDVEEVLNNPDLAAIEEHVNNYAQTLALLGDVDSARALISAQLTAPPIAGGTYANQLLTFAWTETGKLPDGLSQEQLGEFVTAARSQYENDWPDIPEEKRTFDHTGLQACLSDIALERKWPMPREVSIVKALDISLRLKLSKPAEADDEQREPKRRKLSPPSKLDEENLRLATLDPRNVDLVKLVVERWKVPRLKTVLCSAEQLWPYFMRGLLADAFGLSREEVKAKGKLMVETYAKRLHSHPRPLASKTTAELVQLANENTIKNTSLEFWSDGVVPTTLLHEPATDTAIGDLETRLEVILPEDFKDFLRITNGFGSADQGIFTGVFPDPNLRSTVDIQWIDHTNFEIPVALLDLPLETESLVEDNEDGYDTPFPIVEKALELGQRDVDSILLIPPETTKAAVAVYRAIWKAASEEQKKAVDRAVKVFAGSWEEFEEMGWCCVSADLGTPGFVWFGSFREYLEKSAWNGRKAWEGE